MSARYFFVLLALVLILPACGDDGENNNDHDFNLSEEFTNACGGTEELENEPAESCGPCSDGVVICASPNVTVCQGARDLNACGGCSELAGQPGSSCEPGRMWTCHGENLVVCEVDTTNPPAAPTSVTATNAVFDDRVEVSWAAVPAAASYRVYRDGTLVEEVPETGQTNYTVSDTGAEPAGVPEAPPNVVVEELSDRLRVSFDVASYASAPFHTYTVFAVNVAGQGPSSFEAQGRRAAGDLTYEVRADEGDWQPVLDPAQRIHEYDQAPAPVIDTEDAQPSVSQGTFIEHVLLSLTGAETVAGAEVGFEVRATNAVGTGDPSPRVSGRRQAGPLHFDWQSSFNGVSFSSLQNQDQTDPSHQDTDAPATGWVRHYRVVLSAAGTEDVTIEAGTGFRATPEAPQIINLTGPSTITNETDVALSFACSKNDCSYVCEVAGTAQGVVLAQSCDSPFELSDLADDSYTFSVVATDPAGTTGEAATHSWTVDTVVPTVAITAAPEILTKETTAVFSFDCSKADCSFTCDVVGSATGSVYFGPCESGAEFEDLADDHYTFTVTANDAAGNQSSADWSWTVDAAAPQIENLSGPEAFTNQTDAAFHFSCSKPDCTFHCEVVGAEQGTIFDDACTSGVSLSLLDDDAYTFYVTATDSLDNTGEEFSWSWTVDRVAPIIMFIDAPPLETTDRQASFEFECANKPSCVFQCALDHHDEDSSQTGSWQNCSSPHMVDDLEVGQYTLRLRATDAAGNVSEESLEWTVQGLAWAVVSAGGNHSCGMRNDGTLWCWGYGSSGRLGLGDSTDRAAPEQVGSDRDWQSVSAGAEHTCGVRDDGTLWCWGFNGASRLGLGHTNSRHTPQQVGSETDWQSVSAGRSHTCAVRTDSTLWCWGSSLQGQVGVGGLEHSTPQQVGSDTNWQSVSAGREHTCGVREDSTLWCWGHGAQGKLGLGDTTRRTSPHQVGSDTDWQSVSAGSDHTCGVREDSTLWCWGAGGSGRLGLGDTSDRHEPHQVGSDTDWQSVSTGNFHSCGMQNDGVLSCWGSGVSGRLGLGDTATHTTPHQTGIDWQSVSAGGDHNCGLQDDGTLSCWGSNSYGKLGLGFPGHNLIPQPMEGSETFATISAGSFYGCGLRDDGTLWCWGSGEDGRLGLGDELNRKRPRQVGSGSDWESISPGREHSCGLRDDGSLWCWGSGSSGQLGLGDAANRDTPHQVGSDTNWQSVSTGGFHSCGVRDDATLWCWGSASTGQLGLGDTSDRSTPEQVGSDSDWQSVSAGWNHTCGLRTDGTLWCWGSGLSGRLGLGDTSDRSEPEQVGSSTDWQSISAGGTHTCGVQNDESLWCWGSGVSGRLGLGDRSNRTAPEQVGVDADWQTVSAGGSHTCGVRTDGTLWCWGMGLSGRLGLLFTLDRTSPHQVGDETDWQSVSAGVNHTHGLRTSGAAWSWGWNDNGQQGDGSAWREEPTQVPVP